ncbi:hypothetical protein RQP46_005051 [Phenoliferia psychrophenolica]
MHVSNIICTLAFAASSLAITISKPTGWTTHGPNVVSWTSVPTDPKTFAAVLANWKTPVTLETNETTSAGTFTYAQSEIFNITPGTSTSSSSTNSSSGTSTSAVATSTGKSAGNRVQIASGAIGLVLAVLAVAA